MSSEYFSLNLRQQRTPANAAIQPAPAVKPQIAVAKKLLPRAVDRNLVKRIVRECIRLEPLPTLSTISTMNTLIRLKKRPPLWPQRSARARKAFVRSEIQAVLLTAKLKLATQARS